MFLPVDWRTSLTLDNGLIDSITIKNVQTIRNKLNYSVSKSNKINFIFNLLIICYFIRHLI
jgi:hypothetical protein